MRVLVFVLGFAALACLGAQASPDFPLGAEASEKHLLAGLDTYWQGWIKEQARTVVSSGRISEDRARSLAEGAHMSSGADVNSMSFLLLMQAARDADADLQATMDRSQEQWADQEERSNMAHTSAPVVSQLSPETQTVLSMRARVRPVMTLRSNEAPPPETPTADVDLSVHLDLQTAMDHQAAAEDALSSATKRVLNPFASVTAP